MPLFTKQIMYNLFIAKHSMSRRLSHHPVQSPNVAPKPTSILQCIPAGLGSNPGPENGYHKKVLLLHHSTQWQKKVSNQTLKFLI